MSRRSIKLNTLLNIAHQNVNTGALHSCWGFFFFFFFPKIQLYLPKESYRRLYATVLLYQPYYLTIMPLPFTTPYRGNPGYIYTRGKGPRVRSPHTSDHRNNKEGELKIGGGKTPLNPTRENLPVHIRRGLERGPSRGSQVVGPAGDFSYSGTKLATAF